MNPPPPMGAHLSATLENTPEPEGMIYGAPPRDIWSVPGRGRRRAASNGSLKRLPPGRPCLVSWRATYGIGTRPRNSPNRIHRTASIGRGAGLVAGCHRRWRPSALTADVRSRFRRGTRAAYPPAGGCGPPQSPTTERPFHLSGTLWLQRVDSPLAQEY